MNKKRILASLFFLIIYSGLSLAGYAGEPLPDQANIKTPSPENLSTAVLSGDSPKVVVPEMVYVFPDALENTKVIHDYVIQNKGTAMLDIIKVKPG